LLKGVFQGHETGSIEKDSSFSVFSKHFSALFLKRYIYGKRDSRMFLCQMVLPAILVILGLSLLLLQPDQNQPGYTLSPNDYNIIETKSQRNYVPMNALGNVGQEIASRFNGDYSDDGSGVWGVSVPIHTEEDQFSQCSSGAEPLRNMSNFLIASKPSRRGTAPNCLARNGPPRACFSPTTPTRLWRGTIPTKAHTSKAFPSPI
jgi:hypothetical protein